MRSIRLPNRQSNHSNDDPSWLSAMARDFYEQGLAPFEAVQDFYEQGLAFFEAVQDFYEQCLAFFEVVQDFYEQGLTPFEEVPDSSLSEVVVAQGDVECEEKLIRMSKCAETMQRREEILEEKHLVGEPRSKAPNRRHKKPNTAFSFVPR